MVCMVWVWGVQERVVMGAPGSYYWRGTVKVFNLTSNTTYNPDKDHVDSQRYSYLGNPPAYTPASAPLSTPRIYPLFYPPFPPPSLSPPLTPRLTTPSPPSSLPRLSSLTFMPPSSFLSIHNSLSSPPRHPRPHFSLPLSPLHPSPP